MILRPESNLRLRLSRGQWSLGVLLLALLGGLVASSLAAQADMRQHTDAFVRTEASSTNAVYTMRDSLGYSLTVQRYLLGEVPHREVQIARALLAQRLSVVDETGATGATSAGPAYGDALARLDAVVLGLPPGTLAPADRTVLSARVQPALQSLEEAARRLVDQSWSVFREQSRLYDERLLRGRAIELTLLFSSLAVGALLLGWLAMGVRRQHRRARALLDREQRELVRTREAYERVSALDRGQAGVLELVVTGADLWVILSAIASVASQCTGGRSARITWGGLVSSHTPSGRPAVDERVAWSGFFGTSPDGTPGELVIHGDPTELDEDARQAAQRCHDLARLVVAHDASGRLTHSVPARPAVWVR